MFIDDEFVKAQRRAERQARRHAAEIVRLIEDHYLRFGGSDLENALLLVHEAYEALHGPPVDLPRPRGPRRQKTPTSAATLRLLGISCIRCGGLDRVVLDHVVPVAHGGTYEPGNVQPLCTPCNSSKGARA